MKRKKKKNELIKTIFISSKSQCLKRKTIYILYTKRRRRRRNYENTSKIERTRIDSFSIEVKLPIRRVIDGFFFILYMKSFVYRKVSYEKKARIDEERTKCKKKKRKKVNRFVRQFNMDICYLVVLQVGFELERYCPYLLNQYHVHVLEHYVQQFQMLFPHSHLLSPMFRNKVYWIFLEKKRNQSTRISY